MKITYKINYVCSESINSKENVDFEFVREGDYIPKEGFLLGGKYCVVSDSYYEVAIGEAVIYATCFFPRNRVETTRGQIDSKEAQKIAFIMIAFLTDQYGIKGTYTTRV